MVAGDTVQLLLGGSPLAHPVTHVITASDVMAGSVSLTVISGDLGADGTKQVTAQFSDAAGNSSMGSAQNFTLDTTAPMVAITSPGGLTNQAAQTITGTVDVADAGATVTIFNGAIPIGSAIVQSDGTWSSSVTLNNGSNALTALVADAAGNLGASNGVIYTIDEAPVATPVTLAAGNEDTAYTITAATLSGRSHRRRRPVAVNHVGQRGERRRQHRRQRQRHLDLHAGSQLQRPGQLQLHRLRRRAERQFDRQPDPGGGQRCAGDHGGVADGGRGRHGADHAGQYRGE